MPMYNLVVYSDNYSKLSEILWQYFRDEPALADKHDTADFNEGNADTNLFKTKKSNRSNRRQWHKICFE